VRVVNVVVCIIALLAVIYTVRLFAKNRSTVRSTMLWVMIWLAIGVFGLFPHLLDSIMVHAAMRDRLFFVVLVAVLILYAFSLRQSIEVAAHKRRLHRVAQALAVLRYEMEYGTGGGRSEQRASPSRERSVSVEDRSSDG